MKVVNLTANSMVYTSNVYLVTGTWNRLDDVNTLIDVGRDSMVIKSLWQEVSTGVGKPKVEQVILTHSHYDHAELLPKIIEAFRPKVYAASHALNGVDCLLKGGETLKVGDRFFEVIWSPGHSHDSICLYSRDEKALFAGDTPLIISSNEGTYSPEFVKALKILAGKEIETIYFGHGDSLGKGCKEALQNSLKLVGK